jgi:predicted enzyme related to lactoylglutathione lyase
MTTAAPAQTLGRLAWTELMTSDQAAAETFYAKVIGWTSEPFAESPMPYSLFKKSDGTPAAGLMETPEGMNMPPFWSMYIAVPDFDAAVGKLKALGGTTLSDVVDVPSVGRMQMVKDPQGSAFYVMQPESLEGGADGDPAVGDASWIELMTTDLAAATTFYQQYFGWEPGEAHDMGPMGTYQIFNRGGRMLGGMMNKPAEMAEAPPQWAIYFRVDDLDAAAERVTANGGRILNGPVDVPGGDRIVNALDPQGAAFSLHEKKG